MKKTFNVNSWLIIVFTAILTAFGSWAGTKMCEGVALVSAIPQIQKDLKELAEHRCRCGDAMASREKNAKEIVEAYRRLNSPKETP